MLFLIFSSDSMYIPMHTLQSIPIAVYLGGLVGVIVISLSNYITPKISAFYLTLLIFIGQLFAGTIIDFFLTNELNRKDYRRYFRINWAYLQFTR